MGAGILRKYSLDYVRAENAAKSLREGLWRGKFVPPWEWRRGKRLAAGEASEECRIKGNISHRGERIYHIPGGQHYDKTKIDPARGERWFCTEDEAGDAGWRRSRR